MRKIGSFGDPRLYAVSQVAESLSKSQQPLVPERMFLASSNGHGEPGSAPAGSGMLGLLLDLLVAEKSGFKLAEDDPQLKSLRDFAERMSQEAMASMEQAVKEEPKVIEAAKS